MNKKGGVGKTSIAFSIAKDLKYFLISNDDSVIEEIYPKKAKIMPKIRLLEQNNIVYDLGGFIDKNALEIIKKSNLIILPTFLDVNSLKRTINTVKEIESKNKNIIIVINNITNKDLKKYYKAKEKIESLGLPVYVLPKSEIIPNSLYLGKSITEQYNENNKNKYTFKNVFGFYSKLLDKVKKEESNV
jgi:cellulose biosynthesis protein BcsQ